jgi:hypothetical protein
MPKAAAPDEHKPQHTVTYSRVRLYRIPPTNICRLRDGPPLSAKASRDLLYASITLQVDSLLSTEQRGQVDTDIPVRTVDHGHFALAHMLLPEVAKSKDT